MNGHTSRKSENVWNFVFSVFFIIILVGALWLMKSQRGGYLTSVTPFDAILMALAAFRITRLVVYDKITRWFRDLFENSNNGFTHTVRDLLNCPWCISFWSSLLIVVCYFIFAWAWSVILFLAVAGVGSLVQLYANGVGWEAENLKLEAGDRAESMRSELERSSLGK